MFQEQLNLKRLNLQLSVLMLELIVYVVKTHALPSHTSLVDCLSRGTFNSTSECLFTALTGLGSLLHCSLWHLFALAEIFCCCAFLRTYEDQRKSLSRSWLDLLTVV